MALPTIVTPTYTLEQPSTGKQIPFRPFLVKEEKLLLMASETDDEGDAQKEAVQAIRQVITNCCEGLDDIDDLPLFDLEYIFLQLRAKSVGEVVEPVITCPTCAADIKLKIDLTKVKVTKPKEPKFDIRLTDDIGIKMKYPSFQVFQSRLAGRDFSMEQLFDVLIDCIECIYTSEEMHTPKDYTRKELSDFLDSLTQEQFRKIQAFFDSIPRVEHKVKYTCKNKVRSGDTTSDACGHKGEIVLSTVNDFFG